MTTCIPSHPRVTFGLIVLNGEPFVRYNLRSLYPFAHQIIVVEGAAPAAASQATADGHSTDGTLSTLRDFVATEDPMGKVTLVTAEHEGHADGFWSEKDEMSAAYARRATGDYLWQVDIDEFYQPDDMQTVLSMLGERCPGTVAFRTLTFWGGLRYRVDGVYLRGGGDQIRRLFAWGPGYRYVAHRPPTVVDDEGRAVDLAFSVAAAELARAGIYLYHYELLFPKQVEHKCAYYSAVDWTDTFRSSRSWMEESYITLRRPFRVHMDYLHLSWLQRYSDPHPPQVVAMMRDVQADRFPGVRLRRTHDVECLLGQPSYRLGVALLKAIVFPVRPVWPRLRQLRSWLRMGRFVQPPTCL